jgi:MFS family permease
VIGGLLALRESDLHRNKHEEIRSTLKEAFEYVKQHNEILSLMIVVFFGATFGLNFQIFNALMATSEFHKGPAQFGALGSTLAIGSLTGALLTARLPNGRTPRRIMGFAIMFGSALIGISFAPTYLVYSIVLPIAGALAITTMVSSNSYVQTNTEPRMRGRVMGIYLTVFMGGTPVGAPIVGYLSSAFGIRDTMRLCGLITVLAALSAMSFVKRQYAVSA